MTKQQTIELLQKQMPSFYSLEQVINIIEGINEPQSQAISIDLPVIMEQIETAVSRKLDRYSSGDLVDFSSAEFFISSGNRIELDDIAVYQNGIVEMCSEAVADVLREQLTPAICADQDA